MHEESTVTFIEGKAFKTTANLLRAVTHPLRIKILNFIGQNQPVNVNSIYRELLIDQSLTSQHLRILRDAALVTYERKGKEIYYSQHLGNLEKVAIVVNKHFKPKLDG